NSVGSQEKVPRSIVSMCCDDLKLKQFGYSKDTICLTSRSNSASTTSDRLRSPIMPFAEFKTASKLLAGLTRAKLSDETRQRLKSSGIKLETVSKTMYTGEEVEVSSNISSSPSSSFTNPRFLHTLTAVHLTTSELLK